MGDLDSAQAWAAQMALEFQRLKAALRRELDEISQKLSDRKLVDKAKGVLMVARGLDEDAAYHAIRKLAMERGQPMAKIARDIIDMAKVLL